MFDYLKGLFSNRKGLTAVSNIVLKDAMSEDVKNAILTCYSEFCNSLIYVNNRIPEEIDKELWIHYRNRNLRDFYEGVGRRRLVFEPIIEDIQCPWYKKLDVLELVLRWLSQQGLSSHFLEKFENNINNEFERLNYGYRIVNHKVTDITSEEEKKCIEDAIEESKDNVKEHLNKAIEYYSQKPESDNRNSIKESISAVEAVCRDLTGEDTLGKALNKLEERGIAINNVMKVGIEKLYAYTNQPNTGIRHALMDTGYIPSKAEAYFMIVSCSAFINYLRMTSCKS